MTAEELRRDGPADAAWTLILAHGAGQDMDSEFMRVVAEGIAAAGVRVLRFEFPYMAESRRSGRRRPPDRGPVLERRWREVLERYGEPRERVVIGGKSLGGRIASGLADAAGVAGLVCLGYPFHPPGRPEQLRLAALQALRTPALICQGERDPFGSRAEVEAYRLAPAVRLHWLPDGEHSFKPRQASGVSWEDNLTAAAGAVAAFIAGLAT